MSTRAATESSSFLQVPGARTRVLSHHMRELGRGKFLVKGEDITLLNCIGEGVSLVYRNCRITTFLFPLGEFGIVYKARLGMTKKVVAVKTLKG